MPFNYKKEVDGWFNALRIIRQQELDLAEELVNAIENCDHMIDKNRDDKILHGVGEKLRMLYHMTQNIRIKADSQIDEAPAMIFKNRSNKQIVAHLENCVAAHTECLDLIRDSAKMIKTEFRKEYGFDIFTEKECNQDIKDKIELKLAEINNLLQILSKEKEEDIINEYK